MSAEEAFILNCLTHRLYPDRPLPAQPDGVGWDRVYALLERHGLTRIFYRMGQEYPALWPDHLQQRLRRDYHAAILLGDECAPRVRSLLAALREAGIRPLVFKGWALIPTLYGGDYGQRIYSDVDVLVRPQDAARAEKIAESLGYLTRPEPWPGFDRRYRISKAYWLPAGTLAVGQDFTVGLHWGPLDTPYYFRIPADDLFARSVPLQVAGQDVATLSPEDQVVYACGHLALHHRYDDALVRYYELAWGLLQAGNAFDWGAAIRRTQEWRLVLPVQHVLRKLEGLWPETVPGALSNSLRVLKPRRSERFVHRWVVAETENPGVRAILSWLTMPGFGRRWLYLLEHAFPGPDYLEQRYGPAPGGLWPLLYGHRIGLAARYTVAAVARRLGRSSKHASGA